MAPETMVSVLAATLLATGWALWRLPVGTCPDCPHCRAEKLARERADEAQTARFYGVPRCPACGRYHQPEEGHRT